METIYDNLDIDAITGKYFSLKIKIVTITSKNNCVISMCTTHKARNLVSRGSAVWNGYNNVKLLLSCSERKRLRKEVIEASSHECYICGEYIEQQNITLDHIIPKAEFGRDTKSNLRCCCKRCNEDKADRSLSNYVEDIKSDRFKYTWITDKRMAVLESKI